MRSASCLLKIALLGFGTVASGVPFLLKENGEKISSSSPFRAVAKVLVKDDVLKKSVFWQQEMTFTFCYKC